MVTVALVDGAGLRLERETVDARRHAELLAPMVNKALAEAGARPVDLSAVAVGVGPGPFTGLRVGIATASALADALHIPAYSACSLDVIARAHHSHARLAVVTDARRQEVYWATYDEAGQRTDGPLVTDPAVAADRIRAAGCTIIAGAGALLYRDAFTGMRIGEASPYPRAALLADLVAERAEQNAPADVLQPIYLRRPDIAPPRPAKRVIPA